MLKRTFFVTGLPRSRTAWLANFLTHGNSLCFHEISRQVDGVTRMVKIFEESGHSIAGTADSGFLHYHETALQLFPNAAVVIVEREPNAAANSLAKFLRDYVETTENAGQVIRILQNKLNALKETLRGGNVMRVPFAALNSPAVCENLWAFCTGEPFNRKRWEILNDLKIETFPSRAILQARENGHQLEAWFPTERPGAQAPKRGKLEDQYNGLLLDLCKNTPGAAAWVQSLWEILLTWDHIEDGDAVDRAVANRAFEALMLHWPQNPFFNANKERLLPVMFNAVSAWRHSNAGGPANKGWDFYTEIPCTIAAIIGGMQAVNHYVPRLRALAERIHAEDDKEDGIQETESRRQNGKGETIWQ